MHSDFRSVHWNPHNPQIAVLYRYPQKVIQVLSFRALVLEVPTITDVIDDPRSDTLSVIYVL